MASDEERREVAARLRSEAGSWREYCGDDTIYSMSDHMFTERVLTVFGFDDMEMEACRIFEKLADLIDRPVTHNIAEHPGFKCKLCGDEWPLDIGFDYCPRCGAEVVS